MITLFAIVVVASLVLAVTRAEGMRPLGLAFIGMISLVLGARATAVFTETSIAPLVDSLVFAQESEAQDTDGSSEATAEADQPEAATADAADTNEVVKPAAPDLQDADQQDADQQDADQQDADQQGADQQGADATAADEPSDAELPATETTEPETTTEPAATASDEPEGTEPAAPPAVNTEPEATESVKPIEADAVDSSAEATASDAKASEPLTVETITNVKYLDRGENAPEWLETKPWTEDGVHFIPVVSRLQISERDRDRAMADEIKAATNAYINDYLDNKLATTLMKLHSDESAPKARDTFNERVVVTAGEMHQSHTLLAFDQDFHDRITAEWQEVRATSRLMQTALGAGFVILMLSTMFSYFKLDTATRGYYTGRLQFAAAAAILAVIAVSVLFANYVPWM